MADLAISALLALGCSRSVISAHTSPIEVYFTAMVSRRSFLFISCSLGRIPKTISIRCFSVILLSDKQAVRMDVVLMKSELTDVPAAIRLSRATVKNIKENLFWAFIYNIIGIPLAAGVWIPIFGWTLNPMFGAFAMSLSSFCVVTNALRLNLTDIYDKNKRYRIKEDKVMTKTMKIEGMMCGHCEARVKKSLEALDQVQEAVVSHETGTAVVTLKADVDDSVLKKTVEDQDYKVTSIQ